MIDIEDDEAVLNDMAHALDVDVEDLEIDRGSTVRFATPSREVTLGDAEFIVWQSEEAAAEDVLEQVKEDLRNEPENFTQSWLQGHLDEEKLKKAVYDMVMEDEYVNEMASDDSEQFWKEAARWDVADLPEEDEDGELPSDVDDKYIDDLKERIAEDRSRTPMSYLEDMLGGEGEAIKWAMENIGIDIDAAADEAVSTDGWQHFAASYDGNSYQTLEGLVYVQTSGRGRLGRDADVPGHMRMPKF